MATPQPVHMSSGAPRRGSQFGTSTCVAADHPLATMAGQAALAEGGTAIDAAVAMAAVMTVVQPQYSHVGGDLFAVVYGGDTGNVTALNSSGPAPMSADPSDYREDGIPLRGARAVTVPGCVDGWWQLHQRFGRLDWGRVIRPATDVARDGFRASHGLGRSVPAGVVKCTPADYFEATFGHVGNEGGERVVQPELGETLATIANEGRDGFYRGWVAERCLEALNDGGAGFTEEDWQPPGEWVAPLSAQFAGHTVYTLPPPSRGMILLRALRALEQRVDAGVADSDVAGLEAIVDAFADVDRIAGDPAATGFSGQRFVDGGYQAAGVASGKQDDVDGDTTYLLAIDGEGTAVSLIQSVFYAWGAGMFVPGTGILMNNRMQGFNLEPGHPNELQPGKRPLHTLHSYLGTRENGELAIVGGTPGADRQPQTNLQVLDKVLRQGYDVQDALDAPRWGFGTEPGSVDVEQRTPDTLGPVFEAAGYTLEPRPGWDGTAGRAYVASVADDGISAGGDLRGDGLVLVT
jgi:gamma-glutamyltranspeptidase / glutathione hydrolase